MNSLASQQSQVRGYVAIIYTIGQYSDKTQGSGLFEVAKLIVAIPCRIVGAHMCCDNPTQYVLLGAAFRLIFRHRIRARIKVHFGSHLECEYALNGYGIPIGSLPLTPNDYQPAFDNHMAWFKECESRAGGNTELSVRKVEAGTTPTAATTSSEAVVNAREADILLGQGYSQHKGNLKLHQMMDVVEENT